MPKQKPRIRESVRQMIKLGISPMSIVFAHGRLMSPDEAQLLQEYEATLKKEDAS